MQFLSGTNFLNKRAIGKNYNGYIAKSHSYQAVHSLRSGEAQPALSFRLKESVSATVQKVP